MIINLISIKWPLILKSWNQLTIIEYFKSSYNIIIKVGLIMKYKNNKKTNDY